MWIRDNPVLQFELLRNLRLRRSFVLLLIYPAVLMAIVLLAWPREAQLDLVDSRAARRLVNLLFLGQYLLGSLVAPTYAAAALTGEKERQTFEMLVATPLRPGVIVLGKLLAALCQLLLLLVVSLPIVVVCLPLGGVSVYEVLAGYVALFVSFAVFGLMSLAASSYFQRTVASLVVSYLLILPVVAAGISAWISLEAAGGVRLYLVGMVLPVVGGVVGLVCYEIATRGLLHPTSLGGEGKQVVDEEQELREAVGLVIRRGQFPDRLFAPAKRTDLLPDGANPLLDKEMRSEIFSQGTLMLRVVIQLSMLLALPMMFFCFYLQPANAPLYIDYVLLFNLLVGPVFSASAITGERERRTLDLLLTTLLRPWQIIWAKFAAGLRVSSVLTALLLWPLVLAAVLVSQYWNNLGSVLAYGLIVLVTCLTTSTVGLMCSLLARRTSISLMTTYLVLGLLFFGPPVGAIFYFQFFRDLGWEQAVVHAAFISPLVAPFGVPLDIDGRTFYAEPAWGWAVFVVGHATLVACLLAVMPRVLRGRWLRGS